MSTGPASDQVADVTVGTFDLLADGDLSHITSNLLELTGRESGRHQAHIRISMTMNKMMIIQSLLLLSCKNRFLLVLSAVSI